MDENSVPPHGDAGETTQVVVTNADLIAAMTVMFDGFCDAHAVPDEMRPTVPLTAFLRWVANRAAALRNAALSAHAEYAGDRDGARKEAVLGVVALATRPDGPNRAIALWPFVTLGRRPNKHEIRSVTIAVSVQFEDATVVPLSTTLYRALNQEPITDAWVFHTLTVRSADLAQHVARFSLDVLHDAKASQCAGLADPAVHDLLRTIVELYKFGRDHSETVPPASNDQVAALDRLLSFCREFFSREVPETVREALAQKKPQSQPASTTPRGGFDA